MKTSEMIKMYHEFLADNQDGFVSNIDSYFEEKLKGLDKDDRDDIIENIKTMIKYDNFKTLKL